MCADGNAKLFQIFQIPNITRVILNRSVSGEASRARDIHKRLLVPVKLILVDLTDIVLGAAVAVEVRERHIEVFVLNRIGKLVERRAVYTVLHSLDNVLQNRALVNE